MKKIKLFSVNKKEIIEGTKADLYCDLYLVLSKEYGFTFLIDSPNFACSDRHPIRLIKHWIICFEEEYVKYLRRYEKHISSVDMRDNAGTRSMEY